MLMVEVIFTREKRGCCCVVERWLVTCEPFVFLFLNGDRLLLYPPIIPRVHQQQPTPDTSLTPHPRTFALEFTLATNMSTSTTPSQPTNRRGINIEDAMSILSARAKGGGDNITSKSDVPDKMKGMGQHIDIVDQLEFTKPEAFINNCDCASGGENGNASDATIAKDEEEDKKHETMKQERVKRGAEIQSTLQSMNVSDLLGMIFGAQQERVTTYKLFDE